MSQSLITRDGGTAPERIGELDLGVVLELLRSRRRRLVLDALNGRERSPFGEVVEYVAREEFGLGYSEKEEKRIHVALYQNHVQRLDDAGVVEFEATDKPLTRGPEFGSVYDTLNTLRTNAVEDDEEIRPLWRSIRDRFRGR